MRRTRTYGKKKGNDLPELSKVHSIMMASAGQTSTQVWQSTHISLSTFALSFSMAIADAGHSPMQVSHPVHLLLSIKATNSFTPSYMFHKRQKKGFDDSMDDSKMFFRGQGHRSCRRYLVSFLQPIVLHEAHRSQIPSGHRPGVRVRSSRNFLRTSLYGLRQCLPRE